MITARNLAVLLPIVLLIAPALGSNGDEPGLEELELGVAREALNLIELEELYQELSAALSGAMAGEVSASVDGLAGRLADAELALQGLRAQAEGTSFADPEGRLQAVGEDIELLLAQNAVLSEKIEELRKAASVAPAAPLAQNGEAAPDFISVTLNRIASTLLVLSDEMRGSVLDLTGAIGGGLGALARIGEGEAKLDLLPGPGLVATVLVLLLGVALASMAMQSYYRGGFEGNIAILGRLAELFRPGRVEGATEIISSVEEPFWDPVPKAESAPREVNGLSEVDEEYARVLLKLGYKDEALSLASPRGSNVAPRHNETRRGPASAPRVTGDGTRGHFSSLRWLRRRVVNPLIVAGNRSRHHTMRLHRRISK